MLGVEHDDNDARYAESNAESAAYIAIDALKAGAMYVHEVRKILRNIPAIAAVMDEEPRAVAFGGKPVEPRRYTAAELAPKEVFKRGGVPEWDAAP